MPVVAGQGGLAYEIIDLVNQVRGRYGLPPYQINGALMAAAQVQADWLAANGIYSHYWPNGSSPQSRAAAAGYVGYATENIVGGTALTPGQGVTWWENSNVHFNTMISPRYMDVGAGFATGLDQNFYVLVVGAPSDSPPAVLSVAGQTTPDENFIVIPITLAAPGEDGSIVHTVQTGQTLWAIAARYEVSLSDLYLFNNLNDQSLLRPGDEIIVQLAEGQAPPPTPTPPLTYVVQKGDSLWTIAARNYLNLADLLFFNNLREDAILRPGQELIIRWLEGQPLPPTPTPPTTHVVQSGETAWGIALRYGLTLEQLLAYNNLAADTLLHPGDELRIWPPDTPTPTATMVVDTPTPVPPAVTVVAAAPLPTLTPTATTLPTPAPTPTPPVQDGPSAFSLAAVVAAVVLGIMVWVGVSAVIGRRRFD
ncbi:MAG: LysM peptidoglycan-binding domain-containing protein [Chloroflexota bacterium]